MRAGGKHRQRPNCGGELRLDLHLVEIDHIAVMVSGELDVAGARPWHPIGWIPQLGAVGGTSAESTRLAPSRVPFYLLVHPKAPCVAPGGKTRGPRLRRRFRRVTNVQATAVVRSEEATVGA